MTLSPESLGSKLAAWALVMALLGCIWGLLIAPILQNFSDQQDGIQRLERLLVEYRARQEPIEPLQEQIVAAQAALKNGRGYFSAANTAAATSTLQSIARQLVEDQRGVLRSSQVMTDAKGDGPQKYALRLDMQLPQDKLLDFLYAVNSADPYLFIENFDLRGADAPERDGAAPSPLVIRADIVGYARMDGP